MAYDSGCCRNQRPHDDGMHMLFATRRSPSDGRRRRQRRNYAASACDDDADMRKIRLMPSISAGYLT